MAQVPVLYCNDTSPFGRKVRIVTARSAISGTVERKVPELLDNDDPLRRFNPLGKMPCLVTREGSAIYDSAVIVDYLDSVHNAGVLPREPSARLKVLVEQALADGIADAAVAMNSERFFRPEHHVSEKWLSHQRGKVERGLAAFEESPPSPTDANIGSIALACALGYLDWRHPVDWRGNHPRLVAWLDEFRAAVPEFDETAATAAAPV